MTNYSHARKAEDKAAYFMQQLGYAIIDRNWTTKWCEIDIVAQKQKTIYFVEVKYRKNDYQGSGLEYITPQKLKQMARSAESWVQAQQWDGDYQLSVIEVSGLDYSVRTLLNQL